jgi:hypothetical protein
MMVAVAGVGLLLGGSLEFMRLRRLSREYAVRAINAKRRLSHAKMSSDWSHERWLDECRRIDRAGQAMRGWMKFDRPYSPERARRHVAYWGSIVAKYERAARYPWLPFEPDLPRPE